jgi:hypothetical protein
MSHAIIDTRTLAVTRRASKPPRFPLGRVRATPGALGALDALGESVERYVSRHAALDWSETPIAEQQENRRALADRGSVLSTFRLADGSALWVATEDDRSLTLLFLPGEI